jgi:hypothetical protein
MSSRRKEQSFDPDDINLLSSAFEEALQTLGLVDRTVPAAQLVAKLIIELAQRGERDPTRLRERLTAADRRAPERMFSAPTSERSRATLSATAQYRWEPLWVLGSLGRSCGALT